jgi:DNA polymerase-4
MKKIIHIDMDCFYAAVEIRDRPELANKPVAVGGLPEERSVLCTCNYIARRYGIHSAMSSSMAYRQCPDLVLLPVDMPKYKAVAERIHAIFHEFTDYVEPLALDEAYLDVSDVKDYHGSATLIAKAIRKEILDRENLIASAGIAPNKFLAKIASGWKKPNGLFVITPEEVSDFVYRLPIEQIFGVGKVTAEKLHQHGIKTCADLQKISFKRLVDDYGKLGERLYEQCRGIDNREVESHRARKSLSVERTFVKDIHDKTNVPDLINLIYEDLVKRLALYAPERDIKNIFIKIKFSDFKQKTAEIIHHIPDLERYHLLFKEATFQEPRGIRLLGLGVHFRDISSEEAVQADMFNILQ